MPASSNRKLSLRQQFVIWIVGGLIVFASAFSIIAYNQSLGAVQDHQRQNKCAHEAVSSQNRTANSQGHSAAVIRECKEVEAKESNGQRFSADSEQNPWQMKLSDALIAYFTYCLVVVGWATMRSGEQNTHDLERARIFVEVKLGDEIVHTPAGTKSTIIPVKIWNHGRTPAILTKIRGYALREDILPDVLLEFPGSEQKLPKGIFIRPGGYSDLTIQQGITDAEWEEIVNLTKHLYCCGLIEYTDIFGRSFETGYCWQYRYRDAGGSFGISPKTKLNYHT